MSNSPAGPYLKFQAPPPKGKTRIARGAGDAGHKHWQSSGLARPVSPASKLRLPPFLMMNKPGCLLLARSSERQSQRAGTCPGCTATYTGSACPTATSGSLSSRYCCCFYFPIFLASIACAGALLFMAFSSRAGWLSTVRGHPGARTWTGPHRRRGVHNLASACQYFARFQLPDFGFEFGCSSHVHPFMLPVSTVTEIYTRFKVRCVSGRVDELKPGDGSLTVQSSSSAPDDWSPYRPVTCYIFISRSPLALRSLLASSTLRDLQSNVAPIPSTTPVQSVQSQFEHSPQQEVEARVWSRSGSGHSLPSDGPRPR